METRTGVEVQPRCATATGTASRVKRRKDRLHGGSTAARAEVLHRTRPIKTAKEHHPGELDRRRLPVWPPGAAGRYAENRLDRLRNRRCESGWRPDRKGWRVFRSRVRLSAGSWIGWVKNGDRYDCSRRAGV